MERIYPELYMLQSGHGRRDGRTDGQTDGQTDGRTEWNQYTPQQLRCSGGIKRCDRQTDRQTDWTIHRDAWSQLKTIGHLSYAISSFLHHFIVSGEFKLELQSVICQVGFWPLWPWPFGWTSLLSLVIAPENFMMIQWQEHYEKGVTDGWTDR